MDLSFSGFLHCLEARQNYYTCACFSHHAMPVFQFCLPYHHTTGTQSNVTFVDPNFFFFFLPFPVKRWEQTLGLETITTRRIQLFILLNKQLLSLSWEGSWLQKRHHHHICVQDHHSFINFFVLQDSLRMLPQCLIFVKMKNVIIKPCKQCITKWFSFHYHSIMPARINQRQNIGSPVHTWMQ